MFSSHIRDDGLTWVKEDGGQWLGYVYGKAFFISSRAITEDGQELPALAINSDDQITLNDFLYGLGVEAIMSPYFRDQPPDYQNGHRMSVMLEPLPANWNNPPLVPGTKVLLSRFDPHDILPIGTLGCIIGLDHIMAQHGRPYSVLWDLSKHDVRVSKGLTEALKDMFGLDEVNRLPSVMTNVGPNDFEVVGWVDVDAWKDQVTGLDRNDQT